MKGYPIICVLFSWLSLAAPAEEGTKPAAAQEIFAEAEKHAERGDLNEAIRLLKRALKTGLERPASVLRSEAFAKFRDNPDARERVRTLLRKHASESEIWMVTKQEPGDRIVVRGKVVDGRTAEPLVGALVYLSQVDQSGNYSTDSKRFNPRLFGFVRTDARGAFIARTIRPVSYRNDEGELELAHIHFGAELDGYREFNAEFVFDNDGLMTEERRKAAEADGIPVAEVAEQNGAVEHAKVVIRLQRTR